MLENISHPHCPYWELYSMFMSCGLIEKHCKRAQACTWSRHTSLLLDNKFCLLWSPNVNRCTCQHSDWSQLPPLHLPNVVSYQCNSSLGSQAIQSPLQVVLWHPFNLFLKFYIFFTLSHGCCHLEIMSHSRHKVASNRSSSLTFANTLHLFFRWVLPHLTRW